MPILDEAGNLIVCSKGIGFLMCFKGFRLGPDSYRDYTGFSNNLRINHSVFKGFGFLMCASKGFVWIFYTGFSNIVHRLIAQRNDEKRPWEIERYTIRG